jgi:Flp pilus assembly pilin Flp
VEYALIIALISVAVIGAMIAFSGGVQNNFGNSTSALQKAYQGR